MTRPLTGGVLRHTVTTTDGARLAVTVTTPPDAPVGPPIVLLHGWGGAGPVWTEVAGRLLRAGHPVVTVDLRGHGDSTLGTDPVTLDRLTADLDAVLDQVGTDRVILGGHSGGGYVALAYAAARPHRVCGLGLFATAAYGQDTPAGELRMFGSRIFTWAVRRPAIGRRMLGQMVGADARPDVREGTRSMFAALEPGVRAAFFRISCGMDLRAGLPELTVPAVVVSGADDRIIAASYGRELAGSLPGGRHVTVAAAGHMLPLEAPVVVADALIALAR